MVRRRPHNRQHHNLEGCSREGWHPGRHNPEVRHSPEVHSLGGHNLALHSQEERHRGAHIPVADSQAGSRRERNREVGSVPVRPHNQVGC